MFFKTIVHLPYCITFARFFELLSCFPMLKILDRYLIKKFLSTVFFSMLIVTMISVAIDFSDKVQNFISKPCTWQEILFKYYPGFIGYMAGLLLPLYTLIGVVFFTSRLAFNAELLSVLNAGVSFQRLLRPYLIAGGLIGGLHLLLNHYIVPLGNKARLDFEHKYVWTDQEKGRAYNVHMLVGPDTKVHVRSYNKANKTISGLRLERFQNNRVVSILDAENATWKAYPNRWEIGNYSIRTFDGLRESFARIVTVKDTAINLKPEDFIYYHNQNEEMTTSELMGAIQRDHERGTVNKTYQIEVSRRTADAVTNIILTVIGLAVAGRKVRGGMGLHMALAIGIGALFVLLSKFASSFASSGTIPVAIGMWIPNIIFICVSIWLVSRAQK